jgi:hypothetical protein
MNEDFSNAHLEVGEPEVLNEIEEKLALHEERLG